MLNCHKDNITLLETKRSLLNCPFPSCCLAWAKTFNGELSFGKVLISVSAKMLFFLFNLFKIESFDSCVLYVGETQKKVC